MRRGFDELMTPMGMFLVAASMFLLLGMILFGASIAKASDRRRRTSSPPPPSSKRNQLEEGE
jgi:hypothetical protein